MSESSSTRHATTRSLDPHTTTGRITLHPHAQLAFGVLVAFLLGCGLVRAPTSEPRRGDEAKVIRIVDGDTIEVFLRGNSETIRYIGIDTPERGQPGYRAAKEANRALVGDKIVRLQQDHTDRDAFGRLLRYVYLEDGTLVNAKLIQAGMAQPVEYPPDTTRAEEFRQLALEAAHTKTGFWSGTSDEDGAMSYGLTTREAVIRRGPGSDYALTTRIPANTLLTIFGRSPNSRWLQVRPPDRNGGWVSADAVEANVPIATIPLGEVDGVTLTGGTPIANRTPTPAASGATCPDGCLTPPAAVCNIKGNVNSSGDRIYHLPGGSLYARTRINTDEGDRWFCTAREAEGAGFRAALR
jgi:endonuclease YncB( thermonuclease family)